MEEYVVVYRTRDGQAHAEISEAKDLLEAVKRYETTKTALYGYKPALIRVLAIEGE